MVFYEIIEAESFFLSLVSLQQKHRLHEWQNLWESQLAGLWDIGFDTILRF
jgi:hypothetical protein